MAILVNKQLPLPPVLKYFCAVLIICSLVPCSDAESCNCYHSDHQRHATHASMRSTFEQMDGDLFLTNQGTCLPGNLGSYMKNSSLTFNFSDTGLFIIPNSVILWENFVDSMMPQGVSFSLTITMSIYRTQVNNSSRLIVAILPGVPYREDGSVSIPLNGFLGPSVPASKSIAGSRVSVQIGRTKLNRMVESRITWIEITTDQANVSAAGNYTVWIDYDHIWHNISVYVDIEAAKPKPTRPVAVIPLFLSNTMGQVGYFGLSSSMGQLLQLHTWSSTVEQLQLSSPGCVSPKAGRSSLTNVILPLAFASAAVTAIMVSIVYCYFKSKYRMWKKDLDVRKLGNF